MLNPYLAASNGTSVEAHLGKHVQEILGEVGLQVGPAIKQVFATAKPVLNCEVAGVLPTKPDGGHWIDTFFPILNPNGNITQVGAVVVELPKDIQLQCSPDHASSNAVLRSWKEIAHYVGASVKTVQRWEKALEFPVRRVNPNKGSVVLAFEHEVEEWLRNRAHLKEAFHSRSVYPPRST